MLEAVLYPSKHRPDVYVGTAFFKGNRKYRLAAKSYIEKWLLFIEIGGKLKKCGTAFIFPEPETIKGRKTYKQLGVVKLNGVNWTYLLVRDEEKNQILIL